MKRIQIEQLKPFQARAIIEELRKGAVPMDHVSFFNVGRENWLTFIQEDLDHYIAEGGAKVRFISGDYGDGKTHFMSIIRRLARQKGFAASFVVLTREVPLNKFELVYREIVRQLQVPTDLSNLEGARIQEPGIRGLLGAWTQSRAEELGSLDGEALKEKFLSLREQLSALDGMDANFANGLVGILDNQFSPLGEKETREDRIHSREALLQWFEGGRKCPCSTAIMPTSGEICASTACTTFPAANGKLRLESSPTSTPVPTAGSLLSKRSPGSCSNGLKP